MNTSHLLNIQNLYLFCVFLTDEYANTISSFSAFILRIGYCQAKTAVTETFFSRSAAFSCTAAMLLLDKNDESMPGKQLLIVLLT